ncbi:COG4705 family protein [Amnibacterium kyonggiense]
MPEPDAAFWVVKVLTTGMGETTSDFLVKTFAPELVVPAALLVLVGALVVQFRARGYHPARYWSAALMVSVFGTMAADVLHVGLGVPYAVSTAAFAIALAAVFAVWWRVERTLSVHAITTTRREGFYWAAVMATFALGTAAGDLTATSLGLGYLGSGILFLVVFAAPGVVFAATRRAAVATFWIAYVTTRPLGASFADWLAVTRDRGGLGLGTGPVSAVLLVAFVVLVSVLTVRARSARAADGTILASGQEGVA